MEEAADFGVRGLFKEIGIGSGSNKGCFGGFEVQRRVLKLSNGGFGLLARRGL